MSAQRLGPKKIRAIQRDVDLPVLRGWSHGKYWLGFVTTDHQHGSWNTKSHEVVWETGPRAAQPPATGLDRFIHYTSCKETWPDDD